MNRLGLFPITTSLPVQTVNYAESVAFHLLRVYNEYAQYLWTEDVNITEISISDYVKLPDNFLAQVGVPIPETIEEEDYSEIEESLETV